eukprot:1957859-Pleurochrysis_carterae.AAC.1
MKLSVNHHRFELVGVNTHAGAANTRPALLSLRVVQVRATALVNQDRLRCFGKSDAEAVVAKAADNLGVYLLKDVMRKLRQRAQHLEVATGREHALFRRRVRRQASV